MFTRAALKSDIEGILKLQSLNLYTHLSEAERAAGFVTTPFTDRQIETLINQSGAFVVENQGMIVGYALAGDWAFFSQWPIFPLMVSRFPQLKFQGIPITDTNTFQYGPVCIERTLRGGGVLLQLFETMRASFAGRCPMGVTFINKMNGRSLAAHTRKLQLEIIDEFDFNNHSFYSLAFTTVRLNSKNNVLNKDFGSV